MNIMQFMIPKSGAAYLYTDSTLRNGLEKMAFHGYRAIPVINKRGKYAGTVTEGDFLRSLISADECEPCDIRDTEKVLIKDIIDPAFNPPVRVDVTMKELFMRVTEQNFVPVVDDRGMFIGIVTRRVVMRHLCEIAFKEKE